MKTLRLLVILLVLPFIQIAASVRCSDEVFLRRAYLTATGALPTPNEAVRFLENNNPDKREALVSKLLSSDMHLRYMQMHWGDILRIKSEFPSNLWPNGVQAYNRWVYEHLLGNTPYDKMVRDLLLSKGSNFRSPAVNFYRAFQNRTPENFYENINLLFLGDRNCADNGYLCFSQVNFKSTKEWKEEIIYIDYDMVVPWQDVILSDGTKLQIAPDSDWREVYVRWLTSRDNRRFAEVMANRMWYWVFGQDILDDPALLKELTDSFISHDYDMKALMKKILMSDKFNSKMTPEGEYRPQRLPAEVIVDALASVTGVWNTYSSRVPEPFTFYPPKTRATHLGDGTVSSSELELFGKVSRDVSLESQRNNSITARQLLYLMNSSELEQRIRKSPSLKMIFKSNPDLEKLSHAITLLTLSRKATDDEIALYRSYMEKNDMALEELACDIMWMQMNSNEFLYNH